MYSTKARDCILKTLTPPCDDGEEKVGTDTPKKKIAKKAKKDSLKGSNNCPSSIIHKELTSGSLSGIAVSPPVIQYNPIFGDFNKTWECSKGDKPKPCPPDNTSSSYAWIPLAILFIIIIVILIWFVWFRR